MGAGLAEEVTDHGGTATLWPATAASAAQQDEVVAQLRAARAACAELVRRHVDPQVECAGCR